MSAFDLDRLCEWVYAKRNVCNHKDVTADILLQCNEQCIEQAVEVVYEEERDVIIKYKPVCSDWQQEQCKLLGLVWALHVGVINCGGYNNVHVRTIRIILVIRSL